MQKIIKIVVDDNLRKLASKYYELNSNSSSSYGAIRANASWVGWIGKVAIIEFFKKIGIETRVVKINNEIFLKINNELYQPKIATRKTFEDPQLNWSALIELPNWEKWKHHESKLLFSYYYEDIGTIWIIGIIDRQKFSKCSKVYRKGERFELMISQQDLIAVKNSDLTLIEDWLIEKGLKKTIKNMNEIKNNIINIIKKYKRDIYLKKHNLSDYTYKTILQMNPSQYKNNAEHLQVAKQYCENVRKMTNQFELTDDEITPAGTIINFIKTTHGPLLDELATMNDIDPESYIKNLDSMILQIISPFGITLEDIQVDYNNMFIKQEKIEKWAKLEKWAKT